MQIFTAHITDRVLERSFVHSSLLMPAVPRSEVLKLVQLVFVVLMAAMQDDRV